MRIHVLSDIHFEHLSKMEREDLFFRNLEKLQKENEAEVLVLAGDVCQVNTGEKWVKHLARICGMYAQVLYVPGNHEYYGSDFKTVRKFFKQVRENPAFKNLAQLENGSFTYKNQRFVGGTGWFPNTNQPWHFRVRMNDFNYIKNLEPEVYKARAKFLKKLSKVKPDDVVVSHHLPFPQSIAPKFASSPLNAFFLLDAGPSMVTWPKVWIHGHTHFPVDYKIGPTRVYCNPFGYAGETCNPNVFARAVLDI